MEHTCTCLTAYRFNCLPFLHSHCIINREAMQRWELFFRIVVLKLLVSNINKYKIFGTSINLIELLAQNRDNKSHFNIFASHKPLINFPSIISNNSIKNNFNWSFIIRKFFAMIHYISFSTICFAI